MPGWSRSLSSALLAASAVLPAACAPGDVGGDNTVSRSSCAEHLSMVESFLVAHPDGPLSLAAAEHRTLAGLWDDVEAACSTDRAARFGVDVLEPWSGSTGEAPSSDHASSTTSCPHASPRC